jgi:hypothetical protein
MKPRRKIILPLPSGKMNLDHPCGRCSACGRIENPEWIAWSIEYDRAKSQGNELRLKDLMDSQPELGQELACPECEGVGFIPTPAGAAIIKVMKRHPSRPKGMMNDQSTEPAEATDCPLASPATQLRR